MENVLAALSNELAAAVRTAEPSIVAVHARPRFGSSGVVWQSGVIVTAEHTLQEEEVTVTLPGGRKVEARVAGRDPGSDVAVLQVDNLDAAAVNAAAAGALAPGRLAMVLGRTAETGINATLGILSAVGGEFRTWRGGVIDRYVRLDATVFPGTAGGLVMDTEGRALGIATTALSRLAPIAITAATVSRVVEEILAKGHVSRPYLGVGLQAVQLGAIVLSVEPGTPAESAGLLVGDILVRLDGHELHEAGDLQAALAGHAPGDKVVLHILRGGNAVQAPVTLAERPRRS
jgi:S1-C subfamily serine protease